MIIDKCFDESTYVSSEKGSLIHPFIKRQGLDQDNMAIYCPVSNFFPKVIEAAMLDQSTYRNLHSTETVLCKIYNDLVVSTFQGQIFLLILLDLSAAFDTTHHEILIEELFSCGIWDSALALPKSYLED